MAKLYVAQIVRLSQDLIEHVINANNLMMRTKQQLDRISEITKTLCTVYDDLEKDWRDERR